METGHQLGDLAVGIACEGMEGPALENDTPSQVVDRVKLLDERNAVRHQYSSFGCQQSVGTNDIIYVETNLRGNDADV